MRCLSRLTRRGLLIGRLTLTLALAALTLALALALTLALTLALAAPARATVEELEVLDEYPVLAATRAVLAFPRVEVQPSFDKYLATLGRVLVKDFRGPAVGAAVDEAGVFPLLAGLVLPLAVGRQADLHHRRVARQVAELRIRRQIADHDYLVVVRHVVFSRLVEVILSPVQPGFGPIVGGPVISITT